MYGIKLGVMTKEHHPSSDVSIYYADIRAFGKDFEQFYERAQTQFGVGFTRGRVGEVMEKNNGNLVVRVENTETGEVKDVEHDLIIISPGLLPPEGLEDLAAELGLELSDDGFVNVLDSITAPVDTLTQGVYVCGCADGPKDIPDSVSAGSAAAMRATITLSKVKEEK
jgi:heterodisulfide reductase subunit A